MNQFPRETNDRDPLNPPGRSFHERGEKTPAIYSTLNVRTLSKTGRYEELIHCAKKQQIDVMSVQEHIFYYPDTEIQYKTSSEYQLITISAWKNDQGSTIGGVGLLLSTRASENLLKVEKISPRIMRADFGGNPKSTLIACYIPTDVSSEADVTQFYNELKDATDAVPAHNVLTVAWDFKAQVGPDDSAFTHNHATNRNGEMLVDYAEEFQLMFSNTNFMKPAVKLWTFQHPSGSSQIDYILIRKKWRNSIRNCQAYSSFSSIGSDHRIVSCTTCLSLRSSKRPDTNPMKTIDWKLVSSESTIRQQFAIDVRKRYDALSKPDDDIETIYNNITICTEEVALSTLPKRKKQKPPPMSSHSLVKEARKADIVARKQHQDKLSKASLRKINQAQRQLDEAYANAEAETSKAKSTDFHPRMQSISMSLHEILSKTLLDGRANHRFV